AALAVVAVLSSILSLPNFAVQAATPELSYDWYRYQGAADSGPKATINCEVTSVAMSIQYARNNLKVPIADIRQFMGKDDLTSTADAQRALTAWGVSYQAVQSVQDIIDALNRGHIVMVGLMMNRISPGADYQKGSSSPSLRFGRYYAFDGPHSVVVKGVTGDKGWFIVYDPNVWDGNPIYWYSDGTPKGKDRYYPVGEFAQGMADLGDSPKGLEILTNPVQEPVGQSAQKVTIASPTAQQFPTQSGDLTVLASSSSSWKSVTFIFRLSSPRSEPFPIAQIGVQGRDPSGCEFFAASNPITLQPGSEGVLAIPIAVGESGTWRVYRILYFAEGLWRELPSGGRLQQMGFMVQ
ncbi:MAG: C39 family peptidase, partial [Dehalococcoidia bacterium]|nr:C39 family peptidase [Dehalococcoidia bacterium]